MLPVAANVKRLTKACMTSWRSNKFPSGIDAVEVAAALELVDVGASVQVSFSFLVVVGLSFVCVVVVSGGGVDV
jgi:hypothetical protein